MPLEPQIGKAAGQVYNIERSIGTFLGQMAESGASLASMVLKELLQNADDAGATEVSVMLDQRPPHAGLPPEFVSLCGPALLVRNNSPFRLASEVGVEHDDFTAICDVAGGHKRALATAAGRFGIGFNSVYFLTDQPVIFSRAEIHVFDLLHGLFEANGWRFSLTDYRRGSGLQAGPLKEILDWCLPKQALESASLGNLAERELDYRQTIFRLPLRKSAEGSPAIYPARFTSPEHHQHLLTEMAKEAVRSILFLKKIQKISFSILEDRKAEARQFVSVEATPCPETFRQFLANTQHFAEHDGAGEKQYCGFERIITRQDSAPPGEETTSLKRWKFHVRHVARFDDPDLIRLREKLQRNKERATPWAALAVPLDLEACSLDGNEVANWRVFLPLLEPGPCACLLSGAFFVGQSRQRVEYRLNESDELQRKTEWNQRLVEKAIIPLLQDVSADLPDLARELLDQHPREYLQLFPIASNAEDEPRNLTDFARRCFSASPWVLRLRDLWEQTFDLLIGDTTADVVVELVPVWLLPYRVYFLSLSTGKRRFVRYTLGNALSDRVGDGAGVTVRRSVSKDVALTVLRSTEAPRHQDLEKLLRLVIEPQSAASDMEGLWAFRKPEADELLRYQAAQLHLLERPDGEAVIAHLRRLQLPFENTKWVCADVGLPLLVEEFRPPLDNILGPTSVAALALLQRLPAANHHDLVSHHYEIKPVVDFLVGQPTARLTPDLRLGFLVRTALNQAERRALGIILLKPTNPAAEDEAFWDVWFRPIFAHVEPSFAQELERLLATHPETVGTLHATDCRVAIARAHGALELLHAVRIKQPGAYARMAIEIGEAAGRQRKAAERVSAFLLETADEQWDSLDEAQRYTVLALPIHRCPNGQFISLLPTTGGDMAGVPMQFRLQSDDDIQDAPIETAEYQLLQTANTTVKRFYRRRLGLEIHGRVAVLKDTLRQIGEPERDSPRMLRYLARYYSQTLTELDLSGDAIDQSDARALRTLMSSARTVPCLDGEWMASHPSSEAWQMADHLAAQRWPQNQLTSLLLQLLWGKHVASIDPEIRKLLLSLHDLPGLDSRKIVELAITSECPEFKLADRVKLFCANKRDFPERGVERSKAAGQLQVPALAGPVTLAEAEFFAGSTDLPAAILSRLAPKAINLPQLAAQVILPAQDVPPVLRAFCVQELTARDFEARLVEQFDAIWPALRDEDRLRVLRYVGTRGLTGQLAEKAARLKTVLVTSQRPVWEVPTMVISPHWNNSKPPHVVGESKPVTEAIPETVLGVWNEWCGVRTFGGVFALIMDGAAQPGLEKPGAAQAVYTWLEKKLGVSPDEEDLKSLRTRAWVLAQRGDALEFKKPSEVLLHPGAKVLGARFWVRAMPLPGFRQQELSSLGFPTRPEATASQLAEIGECLVEQAELEDDATVRVYQLVGQLLEEVGTLREQWQTIAGCRPVYRAFRENEKQVTSAQLFLGDADYKEDLSTRLLCLKSSGSPPPGVIAIYRELGVPDRPSVLQVLHALGATTDRDHNAAGSYARLVRTFLKLATDTHVTLDPQSLAAIRILTCAGTYQPIADCFWDATLDRPERILDEHAHLLIDSTDKPTQALVDWLRDRHSGVLLNLRAAGEFEPADAPVPMAETPEVSYLLSPWRQWFQQATREGSSLRDELTRLGLRLPTVEVAIVPVKKMRIRCRLHAGNAIVQSGAWEGPLAFAHTQDRLYVRIEEHKPEDPTIGDRFRAVDMAIAREIAILLGASAADAQLPSLADGITDTLERPSTVLKRLRESNRENSLHQYHDQVADPAFAELFEEYQRASQLTKRGLELRVELETKMFPLVELGFIRARREQIKGYGYNEFSVFAELLQNAEDAYLQRQQLGMDMPEPCGILFRYIQVEGAGRVLEVEHQGRPFNYWQHGSKQDRSFTKDIEGVIRSAGSFKPHSGGGSGQPSGTAAIGRFGLGFKSVYLITDCPEVYSGDWHFAIESGCLPKELSPPVDLPQTATRIRLPLRGEAEDFKNASQLLGLLPFLSMTKQLIFQPLIGKPTTMSVEIRTLHRGEGTVVEQVHLMAPGALRGDSVRLVRCRSSTHAGQLAFLVTQEGIPARWDEVFQQDLYAALPLQAKLGCGAAASHRFEVQSGRTHLVDPKANAAKITEVTALLGGLVDGLCKIASGGPPLSEVLRRFWSTWQWERGDGECDALRRSLAAELTGLAERKALVPTLDPGHPISLGSGPCFYITEIPDDFRTAIVEAGVTITAGGQPATALAPKNVVIEGFATAYRRACDYAGLKVAQSLAGIGWAEVAAAFRERAWFAENPTLLNRLAGCLNEDQSRKAGEWLALCKVLVEGGDQSATYLRPCELLMADFPGKKHLPRRFLRSVSDVYEEAAVALLVYAGLRPNPAASHIQEWVHLKSFSGAEALGILAFLAEDSRFMGYGKLAEVFRLAWFPANGQRLTTKQAADKKLIPEALLKDEVFRAWLNLTESAPEAPESKPPPPPDPKLVLARLYDWWKAEGPAWTRRYERRLYPAGRPPSLQETFGTKDLGDRRAWITLLLLGSLHTLGRTNLEQHRNFLIRCDERDWLDVFADWNYDAKRWMDVIENYLEDPAGNHDYHQWMKQFVVVFQISKWLDHYVNSFLQVNRRRAPFALDAITSPSTDAANSGGGPDAPALTRALSFGACFVLRELTRLGILQQKLAHRHCYVPAGRVCAVLEAIGCLDLRSLASTDRSSEIHKFLVENMEEGRATFGLSFDLPLLALAEDMRLQQAFLGRELREEEEDGDVVFRTHPSGYVYPIRR